MQFYDGQSDTPFTRLLSGIKWKVHHGLLRGEHPLDELFHAVVPDSHKEDGVFSYETSPLSGNQKITISWRKSVPQGLGVFYVDEVTAPH